MTVDRDKLNEHADDIVAQMVARLSASAGGRELTNEDYALAMGTLTEATLQLSAIASDGDHKLALKVFRDHLKRAAAAADKQLKPPRVSTRR
jgi:DNA polymerase III delta subunit